jgi:elongator complex protein 4
MAVAACHVTLFGCRDGMNIDSDFTMESSFKRKTTSKQPTLPPGTRQSPASLLTTVTSTGIPSLDDILGGGLPLSCSLLILAPDSHSAYGELVQKYFVAQGLACGQRVCVFDSNAKAFVEECMWMPGGLGRGLPAKSHAIEDEEDDKASQHDEKIKIAWRYEQMKKFQTTVPSSTSYMSSFVVFRTGVNQMNSVCFQVN